jgi:putative AdoMet-dependent methyltransferase
MNSERDDKEHFDRWADTYDAGVHGSAEFPFAGYDQVLGDLVALAEVGPGASVLDLGTGTGNLAGLFLEQGCSVWATDFSSGMIEYAAQKYPGVHFSIANIQAELPATFPGRYDCISSAFVFHHLRLEDKVRLVQKLAAEHLLPGGKLLVADVAFPTRREMETAHSRNVEQWDREEHYWAADETLAKFQGLCLDARYVQVSFCCGIFAIALDGGAFSASRIHVVVSAEQGGPS